MTTDELAVLWSSATQYFFIIGISRLLKLWNYLILLIWLQEEARALAVKSTEALLALDAFFPAVSAGFFLSSFSNYSMNLHNFHELIEWVACIEHWLRFKNMLSGKGGKCIWEEGMLSQIRYFLFCHTHASLFCKTDFQNILMDRELNSCSPESVLPLILFIATPLLTKRNLDKKHFGCKVKQCKISYF